MNFSGHEHAASPIRENHFKAGLVHLLTFIAAPQRTKSLNEPLNEVEPLWDEVSNFLQIIIMTSKKVIL